MIKICANTVRLIYELLHVCLWLLNMKSSTFCWCPKESIVNMSMSCFTSFSSYVWRAVMNCVSLRIIMYPYTQSSLFLFSHEQLLSDFIINYFETTPGPLRRLFSYQVSFFFCFCFFVVVVVFAFGSPEWNEANAVNIS